MGRLLFFIGVIWLAFLPQVQAQVEAIFIDPEDPALVVKSQVPFSSEVLLKAEDLPKLSSTQRAVLLNNKKFTFLALSPDKKVLAFCVDGGPHDWTGLLSLADGQVRQLKVSFEGELFQPIFSEDGSRLVQEESKSNKRQMLEVFDLVAGTQCRLDGRKARNKYLNFSKPWFSPEGDKVFFKVEYNNSYRKSLGLRPKNFRSRIGEATPQCGKVRYYTVAEFMKKFPDQAPPAELTLQAGEEE